MLRAVVTDGQRILDSVRRLVRLLRLSDAAAQAQVGLSAAQLFVLAELGKAESLSAKELADRTRTDQSSISVVVARLVEGGYITRERATDDARRLVLTITRAGRAILLKAPPIAQEELLRALDDLTPAARRRFADTFGDILAAMRAGSEAPMFFEDEAPSRRNRKRAV
ncbi:MAG: MarR family winged helix-turn-helix transcriptional regulator [Thermoanaerobaculia bacterium]